MESMDVDVPHLAYLGCAAAQLLAAAGTLAISASAWRGATSRELQAMPHSIQSPAVPAVETEA